jgi:hypothetical protein
MPSKTKVQWYDKDGKPIDMFEADKKLRDGEYKIILRTIIKDKMVSTIWLGLDHSFTGSRPMIFEVMVFKCKELVPKKKRNVNQGKKDKFKVNQRFEVDFSKEYYSERYSTQAEAIEGHLSIVKRIMVGEII